MTKITTPITHEIIDDFVAEINKRRRSTPRPSKAVIHFRSEDIDRFERNVANVPIELLRFRKDNGRIASDVYDYEHTRGPLDESSEEGLRIPVKMNTDSGGT